MSAGAAVTMISDAVLNNLITTIGGVVTTVAVVILQGKRTRRHVTRDVDNASNQIKKELQAMRPGATTGGDEPAPPAAAETDVSPRPTREPRRRFL